MLALILTHILLFCRLTKQFKVTLQPTSRLALIPSCILILSRLPEQSKVTVKPTCSIDHLPTVQVDHVVLGFSQAYLYPVLPTAWLCCTLYAS